MTGLPSSGKSSVVTKLQDFFTSKEKAVVVICEEQLMGQDKNFIFSDSKHEKDVRGRLKSEVIRHLGKDNVVICDGLNYIKGFRYELFCASKAGKTTQLTVQCDLSPADAEQINSGRDDTEKYSDEIFKALVQRYESPISSNRWDAPLYLVLKDGVVNFEGIFDSLFNKKAPPPNLSTQNAPLSTTNFVYELDKQTQAVVAAIMEAQKTTGAGTEVTSEDSELVIEFLFHRFAFLDLLTKFNLTVFIHYPSSRGLRGSSWCTPSRSPARMCPSCPLCSCNTSMQT